MTERIFYGGGRQSGKTSKLLQWMREAPPGTNRWMICCNMDQVQFLNAKHPDLSGRFVTCETLKGRFNPWVELCIDNVDLMFNYIAGPYPVKAWSATTEYRVPKETETRESIGKVYFNGNTQTWYAWGPQNLPLGGFKSQMEAEGKIRWWNRVGKGSTDGKIPVYAEED